MWRLDGGRFPPPVRGTWRNGRDGLGKTGDYHITSCTHISTDLSLCLDQWAQFEISTGMVVLRRLPEFAPDMSSLPGGRGVVSARYILTMTAISRFTHYGVYREQM